MRGRGGDDVSALLEHRAERAAQRLFASLVQFQRAAKLVTLAAAQATVVWLLVRQLRALSPALAKTLCEACRDDSEERFAGVRAALARAEWKALK